MAPDSDLAPVSRLGCYFVFSIDPIATVKFLEDPEVLHAAKNMTNKDYLAYASQEARTFDADATYQSYEIQLVKRGMPHQVEEDFLEADMCVPILPATIKHPLGRSPLAPSIPLPWSDCYHPSFGCTTTIRLCQRYEEPSSTAELSTNEMVRHTMIMREDRSRRAGLRIAYNALHPDCPRLQAPRVYYQSDSNSFGASTSDFDSEDERDNDDQNDPFQNEMPSDSEDSDFSGHSTEDLFETAPSIPSTLVVKASYDLCSVEDIADPEDFFKEMAFLEQLEKDSQHRATAQARRVCEDFESDEFDATPRKSNAKVANPDSPFNRAYQQLADSLASFSISTRLFVPKKTSGKTDDSAS